MKISPFVANCICAIYNAPYFDGIDPSSSNRQFTAGHELLERGRQPRDGGRIRVAPKPAHWLGLAVADAARVRHQPNRKLIARNTSITEDLVSAKDNLGQVTNYRKGPTFRTVTATR